MKVYLLLLLLSFFIQVGNIEKIKPVAKYNIEVNEPSDIQYDSQSKSFWIVSDNGVLNECDLEGNLLRKAEFKGVDFEGVEIVGNYVLALDETDRKIHFFNKQSLKLEKTIQLTYGGARNKGFESIAYNDKSKEYYLITEKDPSYLFVYDENFHLKNQIELSISNDISSARWNNNKLWVLSDEDRKICLLDNNYKIVKTYEIPVINPEGIAFVNDDIYVVSDDLEKMYLFKTSNQ